MNGKFYLYIGIALFFFTSCAKQEQQKKTNFVFILVDDLGWTDLGYSGSDFYETPNIDSLSKKSILFTNAYASGSVCSPSRASIMSGKHPARSNMTDWIPGDDPDNKMLLGPKDLDELPLEEKTIAEVLKENGYATFFAGKWHLGRDGFFPEDQGFEINKGGYHRGSPNSYYSPYNNPKLADGSNGEYLTDRLTNESIKFINERNNNPFFLMLSYYSVHTPIQPSKRNIEKFNDKLKRMGGEKVEIIDEGIAQTTINQRNPAYASMVYALDENIGKLIKALKDKGIYDNTTVIFTSDNGGLSTLNKNSNWVGPTSTLPLRGGKGWLYEGGIRVPLLVKPAKHNDKQRIVDAPVIGHDFYPTILSQAKIQKPKDYVLDGYDISKLFNKNTELDRKEIFWHYPHYHGSGWAPGAAIRQGHWKLIEFYETNSVELYDLSKDISEKNELSSQYPEKVKSLRDKLHHLQKSMNAKAATLNPKYKI
ncbi:sulfatase [Flavivirga spongiicola]|uniref:Sulfatase n=1 Tax=Flavivirga spongiicola TaxID=421621 RepID=A0ABU7XPS7_9FLAO|nr:sulfatase [Flavivirga sp. MEBiC05379]MDO5977448.1 sulfatase [Flavivirga sp. MEBiC05379]